MASGYRIYEWLLENGKELLKFREYAKKNPPRDDSWGQFTLTDLNYIRPPHRDAFKAVIAEHGLFVVGRPRQRSVDTVRSVDTRPARKATSPPPSLFPCRICGTNHPSQTVLNHHMADHNNYFKCQKCHQEVEFDSFSKLEAHYRVFHPQNFRFAGSSADLVRCVVCGKTINKLSFPHHGKAHGERREEVKTRGVSPELIIPKVKRRFSNPDNKPKRSRVPSRPVNMKFGTADQSLKCPHCNNKTARTWQSLKPHLMKYHEEKIKECTIDRVGVRTLVEAEESSTAYWTCRHCFNVFQSYRGLMHHSKIAHVRKCFFCDHPTFESKALAELHMGTECPSPMSKHRGYKSGKFVGKNTSSTPSQPKRRPPPRSSSSSSSNEGKHWVIKCPFDCGRLCKFIQGWAWHARSRHPRYCWRCWDKFESLAARDEHADNCKVKQRTPKKVLASATDMLESSKGRKRAKWRTSTKRSKSAKDPADTPMTTAEGSRLCEIEGCPMLVMSSCGYSAHSRSCHPKYCWKCRRELDSVESRKVHSRDCTGNGWLSLRPASSEQIAAKNASMGVTSSGASTLPSSTPRKRRRRRKPVANGEDKNSVPCLFGCNATHSDFRAFCSHARSTTICEGHPERCWKCFKTFETKDDRDAHSLRCISRHGSDLYQKNQALVKQQAGKLPTSKFAENAEFLKSLVTSSSDESDEFMGEMVHGLEDEEMLPAIAPDNVGKLLDDFQRQDGPSETFPRFESRDGMVLDDGMESYGEMWPTNNTSETRRRNDDWNADDNGFGYSVSTTRSPMQLDSSMSDKFRTMASPSGDSSDEDGDFKNWRTRNKRLLDEGVHTGPPQKRRKLSPGTHEQNPDVFGTSSVRANGNVAEKRDSVFNSDDSSGSDSDSPALIGAQPDARDQSMKHEVPDESDDVYETPLEVRCDNCHELFHFERISAMTKHFEECAAKMQPLHAQ